MSAKCIVKGCSNHRHEGIFIGDICAPCYDHITTGIIGPTDSFLGDLKERISELEKENEKLRLKGVQ